MGLIQNSAREGSLGGPDIFVFLVINVFHKKAVRTSFDVKQLQLDLRDQIASLGGLYQYFLINI